MIEINCVEENDILIKIHCDEICIWDEYSSLWWKSSLICSSFWLKFTIVRRIYHVDEDSPLWWKFIIWRRFIIAMKIYHYNEISTWCWNIVTIIIFIENVITIHLLDKCSSLLQKIISEIKFLYFSWNSTLWWNFSDENDLL